MIAAWQQPARPALIPRHRAAGSLSGLSHGLSHGLPPGLSPGLFIGLLMMFSLAVMAQGKGTIVLPEVYRTPLSDIVNEEHPQWRAPPEAENPWRQGKQEPVVDTTRRARFFPDYDYDTLDDPGSRSLFQNEFELERPRTNIFQYKF